MEVKQELEDRISLLPDYLIIDEILSRLPSTKEAIRTGTLSKRWLHLWPSVPTLFLFLDDCPDFHRSVDETLTQFRHRELKNLNKLELWVKYDNRFKSQVNNWIRFATNSDVQQLHLTLHYKKHEDQFVLEDDSFFTHPHFTHLRLEECGFNPTGPIRWNNLTHLTILNVELDEDLIANILSGCPLLETLRIFYCYGYSLLDITSKSVKNLILCGYYPHEDQEDLDDIIEINAPFISSLTIDGSLLLWKLLLLDVSSLDKAYLDYRKSGYNEMTCAEEREDMLKRFIQHLHHVKELQIGDFCNKALARLKTKGFIFPSNLKPDEYSKGLGYYSGNDIYDFDDSDDYDW